MRKINRRSLPHLIDCAVGWLYGCYYTAWARVFARWWGVKVEAGCRFYGLPMLRRLPASTIHIGRDCVFRSAPWSSLAGISRRCILATVGEHAQIRVGEGCGLSGAVISAATEIILGRRVMVGANSTITDTDWHPLDPIARAAGMPGATAAVRIEDDVWLGFNVLVLKGVTIGEGTTVAANSVVVNSLPAGVMAAGAPARVIRVIGSPQKESTREAAQ
jgi:acetyltransferase-like isoleucine patch superfamily enzyme